MVPFERPQILTDRRTDVVVMEVDDGSPARPEVRDADVDADEESGRGMLFIAVVANRWGVSEDETTTWCTLTSPAVARRA
ncbi:hypothetical protein AB0I10_36820 [Streptomyces sp. NPDC050636]|uniref:hypothetical protein n=1 Tax=Streptomyces sp. NPDC050636 TaxID=3154510 RepID=UPI0034242219